MPASADLARPPVVAVAYSGGRDSTALLHACAHAATPLGIRTLALHVHHGLMPQADAWWSHAQATCRRWSRRGLDLAFVGERLDGAPPAGASVEAWAREQRYLALAAMAQAHGADLVLLAHHAQDQAETFLLQALRGAGAAGLSAMPDAVRRGELVWARPWLARSPQALAAYARRHRLRWVEDPSNAEPRFARSRLRRQVWPVLEAAFPGAAQALGDAARWSQDAAENLAALAQLDLDGLSLPSGGLDLAQWAALAPARGRNVLRHWLRERTLAWPAAHLVLRLDQELRLGRASASWQLPGDNCLRRHRGALLHLPGQAAGPPAAPVSDGQVLCVGRPGRYPCPEWGGSLVVAPARGQGVAAGPHRWVLRSRSGGEQFQLGPGRPARALKKQYQSLGRPAWERTGPLVWEDDVLVAAPGLGVDARCWAPPGIEQWSIHWEPVPPT